MPDFSNEDEVFKEILSQLRKILLADTMTISEFERQSKEVSEHPVRTLLNKTPFRTTRELLEEWYDEYVIFEGDKFSADPDTLYNGEDYRHVLELIRRTVPKKRTGGRRGGRGSSRGGRGGGRGGMVSQSRSMVNSRQPLPQPLMAQPIRRPLPSRSGISPLRNQQNPSPLMNYPSRSYRAESPGRRPPSPRNYRGPSPPRNYRGPSPSRNYRDASPPRIIRGPSPSVAYSSTTYRTDLPTHRPSSPHYYDRGHPPRGYDYDFPPPQRPPVQPPPGFSRNTAPPPGFDIGRPIVVDERHYADNNSDYAITDPSDPFCLTKSNARRQSHGNHENGYPPYNDERQPAWDDRDEYPPLDRHYDARNDLPHHQTPPPSRNNEWNAYHHHQVEDQSRERTVYPRDNDEFYDANDEFPIQHSTPPPPWEGAPAPSDFSLAPIPKNIYPPRRYEPILTCTYKAEIGDIWRLIGGLSSESLLQPSEEYTGGYLDYYTDVFCDLYDKIYDMPPQPFYNRLSELPFRLSPEYGFDAFAIYDIIKQIGNEFFQFSEMNDNGFIVLMIQSMTTNTDLFRRLIRTALDNLMPALDVPPSTALTKNARPTKAVIYVSGNSHYPYFIKMRTTKKFESDIDAEIRNSGKFELFNIYPRMLCVYFDNARYYRARVLARLSNDQVEVELLDAAAILIVHPSELLDIENSDVLKKPRSAVPAISNDDYGNLVPMDDPRDGFDRLASNEVPVIAWLCHDEYGNAFARFTKV